VSATLVNRPIPKMVASQIDKFNRSSLMSRSVANFDPKKTPSSFIKGSQVAAIDIGGDKIAAQIFEIEDNALKRIHQDGLKEHKSHSGEGYVGFLETIATKLNKVDFPIGLSIAVDVEGGIPTGNFTNLPFLKSDLTRYQGDFKKLLPNLKKVVNDAVAGLMAGSIEADRLGLPSNIVYLISGSGLGGAVLRNGQIHSAEPGHIEISPELNTFNQEQFCGFGRDYVCLERAGGGSRAGVEALYQKLSSEKLDGREISIRFQDGEKLAGDLYDHCAKLLAHTILGLIKTFDLYSKETTIVLHGGTFKVPSLVDRVEQILESKEYFGVAPKIVRTDEFSPNACLDGAAIAALAA
jgi:predicted NBD/HSP70 family sugar kinase